MAYDHNAAVKALYELLRDEPTLANIKNKVRGEYVNDNARNTPWLGVYRGPRRLEPYTLGKGADNWRSRPMFRIIVQEAAGISGGEIEERLEDWVNKILAVIKADLSLKNTVKTIVEINVEYSYWESSQGDRMSKVTETDVFFQQADITITAEVRE